MNKKHSPVMKFGLISLFPEIFSALDYGITGKAKRNEIIELLLFDLKKFTNSDTERADDRPFGGGPGMILRYEPLKNAILAAKEALGNQTPVYFLSPQGQPMNQKTVQHLALKQKIILISGRYEGIDERIIDNFVESEISVGDYVLSGGEYAALNIVDAITRILPGSLGNEQSKELESFNDNLLDCPHYTRPETIDNSQVPEVLLSGDHKAIETWRQKQALGHTWLKRPDLLDRLKLTQYQKKLLEEFISSLKST